MNRRTTKSSLLSFYELIVAVVLWVLYITFAIAAIAYIVYCEMRVWGFI